MITPLCTVVPPLPKRAQAVAVAELLDQAYQAVDRNPDDARRNIGHAATQPAHTKQGPARADAAAASRSGGLAGWQVQRVTALMRDRLDTSLSVQEMAGSVRLSRSHFCRSFKMSFCETPHAYLSRMRVRHAQELMLRTAEPLAQIAVSCGLADQAHLSRLFRTVTGETPSSWRRQRVTTLRHAA